MFGNTKQCSVDHKGWQGVGARHWDFEE